ncbi:hypothetical protein Acr_00g0033860 [Actinidia rufa]|uniref:CCHC-type domain-containing protein n=1 Tax=Actinidia rufa TaxID=165716 RepID=A0A7J0DFZ9_9ERIC|nr:hypothetical protein Acr_00g0033860 [Actinidia rufa]
MATESWLWGIKRVFEVLPCTEEQKVVFAMFTFEGPALIWWQLKKPLEPLWLWPGFLDVFNEEYFPKIVRDQKVMEFKVSWPWRETVGHHAPTIRIGRVVGRDRVVSEHKVNRLIQVMPPRRGRGRRGAAEPEDRVDRIERILEGLIQVEVLHAALIAEESLNEMSQFRENRKKRIGGNVNRGQSSKRQSSGSSSGNSSAQQRNVVSQGSSESNELPTCPICQKNHRGECRMGTRACYGCGQEGHQIRDCPMRKRIQGVGTSASASVQQPPTERRNNQLRQGRAFALVPGNTPATTSVVSGLIFEGVGVVPPPYLISSMKARRLI